MMRPETDVEVVPRSAITPFVETDGKNRNYPVFPFDSSRGFEMYAIELDPGVRLDAEPHPEGTQEFITVFSGALTVLLDGERWGIADGDSIRFKADRKHAYANEGNTLCRLSSPASASRASSREGARFFIWLPFSFKMGSK